VVIGEKELRTDEKSSSHPSPWLAFAAIVDAPADHDAAHRQGALIAKAKEDRGQKVQLVDDDLRQPVLDLLLDETRGLGVADKVTKDLSGVEGIGTLAIDELGEVLKTGRPGLGIELARCAN
jgi:hypothetical protein